MSENNPFPNESNTGHIWDDGLRELTNDPPNWWRIGFHASWIGVVLYGLLYPTWPTLSGYTSGMLTMEVDGKQQRWSAVGEYKNDLAAIDAIRSKWEDQINKPETTAAMILADDDLKNYAVRSAKVLFGDYCAACHGSGGAGNVATSPSESGYPVLADDDWIYGGTIDAIQTTIANGRKGVMTPYGARLSGEEIDSLVNHVVALGQGGEDVAGKALFMEPTKGGCFACHGPDGSGAMNGVNLPGVDLTDQIWRFAPGGAESARYTITHGVNGEVMDPKSRNAVMPAFGPIGKGLDDGAIKKLAVYVHQLGGGK